MSIDEATRKFHTLCDNAPVCKLDAMAALSALTEKERLYTHWMSKACWQGSLVVLDQVSPESPKIFDMLQKLFTACPAKSFRSTVTGKASGEPCAKKPKVETADGAKITDTDVDAFLQYAAVFYNNMGNYVSFGDTKFVPGVEKTKFRTMVEIADSKSVEVLETCLDDIYSLKPDNLCLGYSRTGISSYYGQNVTQKEIEMVNGFMTKLALSPYNTRVFKIGEQHFEIRIAAAKAKKGDSHQHEGAKIDVVYGDYDSKFLSAVADCLTEAQKYTANEQQTDMITAYVKHFTHGEIDDHKDAQRAWVRDIGPVVETNIGFIESYRDPSGVRGEFEGFVSVVDKDTSKKFGQLVSNASTLLTILPWSSEFEKDVFLKPDFTSLDVVAFVGSGIPKGINIPNYDDIRQTFGFKNVSLGNVGLGGGDEKVEFLRDDDQALYNKLKIPSFGVQVGAHELLGHGSGKLFYQETDGKFNFDVKTVNPLTKKPIETWYLPGETYDSKFGSMGSSYEECRAECVGIFLSCEVDVLKIFGYEEKEEQDDIMYINWLNMVRAGLVSLEFYTPETKKWRQAHMQARFAILRTLLAAGEGLVTLDITENNAIVSIDRNKIRTVGLKAISEFLTKIQIYKSTADVKRATEMYNTMTSVPDEYVKLRKIVLDRKKPRMLYTQVHSKLTADGKVEFEEFEPSCEGVIQSFITRFSRL